MRPFSLGHGYPESVMRGHEALRRALDLAVVLKRADQCRARLADLKCQLGHTIEIVEPAGNYNCFYTAEGLA